MKLKLDDVIISFDHKKQSVVPIKYDGDPKKIERIKNTVRTKGTGKYGFKINPDLAYAGDFMLALQTAYNVDFKHPYKLYSPPSPSEQSNDGVFRIS